MFFRRVMVTKMSKITIVFPADYSNKSVTFCTKHFSTSERSYLVLSENDIDY